MSEAIGYDAVGLIRGAVGGIALGLGSSAFLLATGSVPGISGILNGLLQNFNRNYFIWKLSFTVGLLISGGILLEPHPEVFGASVNLKPWAASLGGFLVGFGSRLGSGCTSGHGIIGIARLSLRSILAVMTFMGAGVITASVLRSEKVKEYFYDDKSFTLGNNNEYYILPLVGVVGGAAILLSLTRMYRSYKNKKAHILAPVSEEIQDGLIKTDNDNNNNVSKKKLSPRESAQLLSETESNKLTSAVPLISGNTGPVIPASSNITTTTLSGDKISSSLKARIIDLSTGLFGGLTFGLGLILSGMTDPNKVLNFLSLNRGWDPQLMLVMGCALMVNIPLFRYAMGPKGVLKDKYPVLHKYTVDKDDHKTLGQLIPYGWNNKSNRILNWKLFIGSAVFGCGWGLAGICPGPGIVSYVSGLPHFGVAVPSMIFGMTVYQLLNESNIV